MIKLTKLLNDVVNQRDNRTLLLCGGSYGHMHHPFDKEINLTFSQLKKIIDGALNGELKLSRSKTDGQALAVSWKNGKLVAARNKSHLKNKAENAMDISAVSSKFGGRGGLTDAYNFAMKDLSSAIGALSDKQKEKIFGDGSKFMNLEVIYPESVNVIPYGQALLIFHGTMEYDMDGNVIGEDQSAARILAGMIKQVNQNVQSKYTIQGPPVVQLPKNQTLQSLKPKYNGMLNKLQNEFKLKDSAGVVEYHRAWWGQYIDKNSPEKLSPEIRNGLIDRWAVGIKGFRINKKNIPDDKILDWVNKTDKVDFAKIEKENLRKFENIFLGVGADVLSFVSDALVVNPNKAVRDMKKRLDTSISDIRKSGDVKKIDKLQSELERLNAVGGVDKIVPIEGIVFVGPNGETLKLTGSFASLNQILGLMYY
jgi:hypothetical protein